MPRRKCVYALYEGEELIMTGTAKELAEARGVKVESIYQYSKPSYLKRNKGNSHVSVVNLGTLLEVDDDPSIHENVYDMYKDNVLVATGTAAKLAAIKGVRKESISIMSSNWYKKRLKSDKNRIVAIGKTTEMGNY